MAKQVMVLADNPAQQYDPRRHKGQKAKVVSADEWKSAYAQANPGYTPSTSTVPSNKEIVDSLVGQGLITREQIDRRANELGVDADAIINKPPTLSASQLGATTSSQPRPQTEATSTTPTATALPVSLPQGRSQDEILAEARARAAMLVGTRRQEAQSAMREAQALAEQQRQGLQRNLAHTLEQNRYQWAGRNLGTSGFLAGANALAQGATVRELGNVSASEQRQLSALQGRLDELARMQGEAMVANLGELERAERDYGLRSADLASILAGRSFDLERGRALLPFEIGSAALGNQQSAFNLQRGQALLPYEIGSAQLGNIGRDIANQTAQFNLQSAQAMLPYNIEAAQLSNQRAQLQNQVAQLEYEIANNPDYGARVQAQNALAQAQRQLELIDAQIASQQALAAQRNAEAQQESTPPQPDPAELRQQAIEGITNDYNVTNRAAEVWVDFEDIMRTPKADGSYPTYLELLPVLEDLKKGLPANDQAWLTLMFQSLNGNTTAAENLNKWLRRRAEEEEDDL